MNIRASHASETLPEALSSSTIFLLATAAGLSVANIYAAQPLLDAMASDFQLPLATVGAIIAFTQLGYALGLILLVPLGDLLQPRRLILCQFTLSAFALVALACAQSVPVLFGAMVMIGLLAVVAQSLVAFAAALARPASRGKTVGSVTSGIVIGILAARLVAGILTDMGGWRLVYATSAVLTLTVTLALHWRLPRQTLPRSGEAYAAILRSMPRLFWSDKTALLRAVLALLIFASFSTFWTALVLPLASPPFNYSHGQIGLFGLIGLIGAIAASGAGRLADRGLSRATTGAALSLLLASWGLIALLPFSLALLIFGILLLDLAVQAVHVTNQSILFERHPEARSRLVGGYMIFYSAGSALGAISATQAYANGGWSAVCLLGSAFSALALLIWAICELNRH